MSRKKILIVLPSLHQGGVERQVGYLFENLDRSLFDVHLAYFKNEDIFYKNLVEDSTHSHLLGSGQKTSWDTLVALYRLVKQLRPDVLHLYTESANQLGALVSFLAKIPAVIFAVRTTNLSSRDHFFYRFLFKNCAHLTLVNSNGIRQELLDRSKFRKNQVRVLYNFLDTHFFSPVSSEEQRQKNREQFGFLPNEIVIGSLGRISSQKNQQGAVRAIHLLHKQKKIPPFVRFIFFGKRYEEEYDRELKSLIQRYRLASFCQIAPPVSEVQNLYGALDGLFQPVRFEGLSNVVIEAQSCGLPVALSQEGDNDDLIHDGKNGFSFSIASDETVARGLERLLNVCSTPLLRQDLASGARESALKRFSVNEGVAAVQAVYQELTDPLYSISTFRGDGSPS